VRQTAGSGCRNRAIAGCRSPPCKTRAAARETVALAARTEHIILVVTSHVLYGPWHPLHFTIQLRAGTLELAAQRRVRAAEDRAGQRAFDLHAMERRAHGDSRSVSVLQHPRMMVQTSMADPHKVARVERL